MTLGPHPRSHPDRRGPGMDRFTRQPAMKLVRQIATGFKPLGWIASEAFEAQSDQIKSLNSD